MYIVEAYASVSIYSISCTASANIIALFTEIHTLVFEGKLLPMQLIQITEYEYSPAAYQDSCLLSLDLYYLSYISWAGCIKDVMNKSKV